MSERESRREYWVTLPDGTGWSPERRAEQPAAWQEALQKAKGFKIACFCKCVEQEAPLYIFQRAGVFYLARYPNSGHVHSTDCHFYAPAIETTGQVAYADDVITEASDGTKRIRFDFALGRELGQREPAPVTPAPRGPSSTRRTQMSILGLLHYLWSAADLQRWHPRMVGKRNWAVAKHRLDEAAVDIVQRSVRMSQRLIVLPAMSGPNLHQRVGTELQEKVHWATSGDKRAEILLFIGELVNTSVGGKSTRITLSRADQHKLTFYSTTQFWGRCIERFPALGLHRKIAGEADRTIAIIAAEVRKRHDGSMIGDVSAAGFLFTTAEFIPFASSYEKIVTRKLIDQNRWFEKPLRYDAAEDAVLPDFVLLDTNTRYLPMEVYGRNSDDEYRKHRDLKRALYLRTYGAENYWEWNVDPNQVDAVPPFPSKSFQRVAANASR
ncbi:MAG: DUF1173 domain-containing protein [Desulfovibrio sp.]|uniref:DUF1173 family protein n=1 Tax=Desulfovibrio sp. TaxID=885 RepID=UPI00135EC979|nr:DUF1173 family protein [Desulfovibrio sp.]MTJ94325.1 DUF1173 domain-containing protein [Desulfovibrio sp.]